MDDPNQHKMVSDDYEGNSPSQNGNEKGYGNQEYMGEYNANNEYYNNYMEEEEDEQEGQLYAQNMSENREGMRREDYPEDESMEDEDSKFITENPNAGQRGGEEEDSAEYMSREGDHILNDEKDEEDEEGDDMGESERYDYGNKDREGEKESESNFGKSMNQANEDEEDQEQREDDEDDDGDMDQIEGKKKMKTEKGEASVRSQDGDGDKKEGENEEPDSVQREKGDNEGEEAKQGDELKDNEEKKTGEPERRKGGRIPNRLKMLQVQNQGTLQGMTEEDRIFYAIESAKRFNTRILGNRPKLQSYMKQIEKNRVDEKVPIDLLGVPFPSSFVPVYMYDSNGTEYFSMNQAAQIERAPMGKFKRMNIENEGVTLVPEQFNLLKMEPGKRFQRRRKKRPMPIKPAEDSD